MRTIQSMKPAELPPDAVVLVLSPMDLHPHRYRSLARDLKRMKRGKFGRWRCLSIGPPAAHTELLNALHEMIEEARWAGRKAV